MGYSPRGRKESDMTEMENKSLVAKRWWRAGKPGVLHSTGSQRVGHDLVTEPQNQISNNVIPGGP